MKYSGIKNINSKPETVSTVIKKKSLHIIASLFLCVISFACLNVSLINDFSISKFVKRVTSYWVPKIDDMGKIKFVDFSFNNSSNYDDGIFMVSSPFKNYFVSNNTDEILEVYGLGDVVVLSPISGKILSIENIDNKYQISIMSGNVIVKLSQLNYVCTNIGNNVEIGEKIGVSLDSNIKFCIICDGEAVKLMANSSGDTFFE